MAPPVAIVSAEQTGFLPPIDHALTKLRDLGPYAAILVQPGGSVMALLLWLYRPQKKASFLLNQ